MNGLAYGSVGFQTEIVLSCYFSIDVYNSILHIGYLICNNRGLMFSICVYLVACYLFINNSKLILNNFE